MHNLGTTDRVIRAIIGVLCLVLGIVYASYWGWIGILPIGTALLGWSPAYYILGISSLHTHHHQSPRPRLG